MDLIMKLCTKKVLIVFGITIFAIITFFSSFAIVSSGHTGVITQFGAVSDNVLQEGLHFKVPFVVNIIEIDNRVLRVDVDAISASKDLQQITSTVSVNYRVDKMSSSNVYKNVGKDFEVVIIRPAIQECVKAVTAGR